MPSQRLLVLVDAEVEIARPGSPASELLHREFGVLAGLRIELAEELLAEIRVPDGAVDHDHVMRLDGLRGRSYSVMIDIGAAALDPRQGLELVAPGVALAQIDGGEEFRRLAEPLRIGGARLVDAPLRLDRLAHLRIAVHARGSAARSRRRRSVDFTIRSSVWQLTQLIRLQLVVLAAGHARASTRHW